MQIAHEVMHGMECHPGRGGAGLPVPHLRDRRRLGDDVTNASPCTTTVPIYSISSFKYLQMPLILWMAGETVQAGICREAAVTWALRHQA